MTIEQAIKLLKKKATTVENILEQLSDMVHEYQDKRQDYYVEQLGERLKMEGVHPSEIDMDTQTDKIHQQVVKDTKNFIKDYTSSMTDQILDAINEKKIKKDPGFCFLAMLSALEEAFK